MVEEDMKLANRKRPYLKQILLNGKSFVSGHRGMVGSALVRAFEKKVGI